MKPSKEQLEEIILHVYSKSAVYRALGWHCNGQSKKKLDLLLEEYDIDISHFSQGEACRKYPIIRKKCSLCNEEFETSLGSPTEKIYCSLKCSNKISPSGENHYNWKSPEERAEKIKHYPKTKICNLCEKDLPLEDFHKHGTGKYGRNSRCAKCVCKVAVEWRKNNLTKARKNAKKFSDKKSTKEYRRDWQLKNNYGISLDDFQTMSEQQNGCCAICKSAEDLYVDHNHTTGKIRGLLCNKCNLGIGLLQDDARVLESAMEYLNEDLL